MKSINIEFTEGQLYALAWHFERLPLFDEDGDEILGGSSLEQFDLDGAVDKINEAMRPALGCPAEALVS